MTNKLDKNDMARIKQLYESGVKKVELSRLFNVARARITQILGAKNKAKTELSTK